MPIHVVIIGGGVIGLEFADAYINFGSAVDVVELTPAVLPGTDLAGRGDALGLDRLPGPPYTLRSTPTFSAADMEGAARGDSVIFFETGRAIRSGSPGNLFPALAGTAFYPFSWRCRA